MMNLSMKKKIAMPLAALGAALAMTAIVPAAAQAHPFDGPAYEGRYETQVAYRGDDFDFRGLKSRIWQGVRTGDLTRFEARRLSVQVDALEDRADAYSRHGMSRWERHELNDRYRELSAQIYVQRHDDDYRGGRGWR